MSGGLRTVLCSALAVMVCASTARAQTTPADVHGSPPPAASADLLIDARGYEFESLRMLRAPFKYSYTFDIHKVMGKSRAGR